MEFFLDTADLDEIRLAGKQGLIDGVTTNPTLLSRQGGDWKKRMQQICDEVDGPVSLEVISPDAEGMLREAEELVRYGDNVVIKVPMTAEGLIATRTLTGKGIKTNVTLVFFGHAGTSGRQSRSNLCQPFSGQAGRHRA